MLLTRHAARRAAAWSCAGRPTLGTRLAPGLGVRAPLARRVTPGWTPLASNSTISGAEPERKEERKPSGLRSVASDVGRLLQLYRPESRTLGAALTALVLSSGITLAVPAGMGFVIDTVTHTHGARGHRLRVPAAGAPAPLHPPHCRRVAGERGHRPHGAVRVRRRRQLCTFLPPQPRGSVRALRRCDTAPVPT